MKTRSIVAAIAALSLSLGLTACGGDSGTDEPTSAASIPLATERPQAALTAYRGGSGTLASVLEARRMALDTQMDRLRLDMDTARIWAQLNYLIPVEHDAAIPVLDH